MAALPEIDLASPLQFVINAAAGSSDARALREVVEAGWRSWQPVRLLAALQIDRVARLVEHADPAQLRVNVVHQPIAVTGAEDEPNRRPGVPARQFQ